VLFDDCPERLIDLVADGNHQFTERRHTSGVREFGVQLVEGLFGQAARFDIRVRAEPLDWATCWSLTATARQSNRRYRPSRPRIRCSIS